MTELTVRWTEKSYKNVCRVKTEAALFWHQAYQSSTSRDVNGCWVGIKSKTKLDHL